MKKSVIVIKKSSLLMVLLLSLLTYGCRSEQDNAITETAAEAFTPETVGIYEAEDARLVGNVQVIADTSLARYSGTGYVEGFWDDEDECIFTIEIPEDGFYDFDFISASGGEEKSNYVSVDQERQGTVSIDATGLDSSVLERIYLTAGTHEVSYSKYWGWVYLDCLEIRTAEPIGEEVYNISSVLVNENASESSKRLMSYLCDIYGTKMLSGQYCDTGMYGKEFQVIKQATGETPAILGLDFMEYTPSRVEQGMTGYSTDFAIQFWEEGGIVTFCWHWNAPSKYLTGQWYSGFNTEYTNIDLAEIMNGSDEEGYQLLMEDIDAIAQQLLILQEADVPILWRPLHEASGGWFWWGASGAEAYKELYMLLYDTLTSEYGLNNLIWVWNGQDADWYPGDEYVDIIGEDIYPGEQVYTSQASSYLNAVRYSEEGKLVYMTENGCIFDPDLVIRDGAMWGMWCTWSGEFVCMDTAIYSLNEQYTEEYMLKKAYEHESVLKLKDLPDLKNYSSE